MLKEGELKYASINYRNNSKSIVGKVIKGKKDGCKKYSTKTEK